MSFGNSQRNWETLQIFGRLKENGRSSQWHRKPKSKAEQERNNGKEFGTGHAEKQEGRQRETRHMAQVAKHHERCYGKQERRIHGINNQLFGKQ